MKDFTRRFFLKASAFLGLALVFPGRLWAFFVNSLLVRTVEKEDFRFDPKTGSIVWSGKRKPEPYKLRIEGLVENRLSLPYSSLLDLPQTEQVSDFHCVEGWSVKNLRWKGFRFGEIAKRAGPKPRARYVIFHSLGTTTSLPGGLDHYVECLPLAELLDPGRQSLMALFLDGKPLSHDHGAPLRVVSPFDLGYKGAKFVHRIEFSDREQAGWWTLANPIYSTAAPVPEDRLRKRPGQKR